MSSDNNGFLAVFDGIDASGKATQVDLLVKRLKSLGHKAEEISFPRYHNNVIGGLIFKALHDPGGKFLKLDPKSASGVYAADRHESKSLMDSWLADGRIVVCDRYVSANQIHQGGKIPDEKEREEFLAWLDRLEFDTYELPQPDVIVYLHLPVNLSMKLSKARAEKAGKQLDMSESDFQHLYNSQQSALSIVKSRNNWIMIDCAPDGENQLSVPVISEIIYEKLAPLIVAKQM